MANFDPQLVTGGGQPTLTTASSAGSGMGRLSGVAVQPHHSVIGLVLVAVIVLVVLDRAGFRFAVTVGKR